MLAHPVLLSESEIKHLIRIQSDYLSNLNRARESSFELDAPSVALFAIEDEVLKSEIIIRKLKSSF
jgi:hypothetical protein